VFCPVTLHGLAWQWRTSAQSDGLRVPLLTHGVGWIGWPPPLLARQHRAVYLATLGQLGACGKAEMSAMSDEEADGFPPASGG
jgi:hypothetical protein